MPVRLSVVSQKGGAGKTTVVLNLGLALAKRHRVLIVDLDPQGGIALSLAKPDLAWAGLAELLMGSASIDQAIIQTKEGNLSILSRGRLDPADVCEFELALHQEGALGRVLADVEKGYDFVLIDTPAGMGMIPRAALQVTNFAMVTFQAEPLAMRSIGQVLRVIERVKADENPQLELVGILPTMVDAENQSSKTALWTMWSGMQGVLDNHIPRSDVFSKASEVGIPIAFLGGPSRPEVRRFDALAVEVENIIDRFTPKETEEPEGAYRELV